MPEVATREKRANRTSLSYFDINQLELAIINRALHDQLEGQKLPGYVSIGKNARILSIQKRNLERLCRSMRRECRGKALEAELRKIRAGSKVFSLFCFQR
jgi:hypothetical protein